MQKKFAVKIYRPQITLNQLYINQLLSQFFINLLPEIFSAVSSAVFHHTVLADEDVGGDAGEIPFAFQGIDIALWKAVVLTFRRNSICVSGHRHRFVEGGGADLLLWESRRCIPVRARNNRRHKQRQHPFPQTPPSLVPFPSLRHGRDRTKCSKNQSKPLCRGSLLTIPPTKNPQRFRPADERNIRHEPVQRRFWR